MSTRTTEFAAKITGDANGAIAAMERTKQATKQTADAAVAANTKLASSTSVFVKEAEKAGRGVAAITQAIYGLEAEGSARFLALGGAVGSFADLLGPQGKVVSGIALVASSIVALFLQAKEKAAEATKSIEADLTRLVNAGDFAAITKRLQEIERGTAGAGFQDGRAAIRQRIADLQEEYNAVGKTNRFYLERAEKIKAEKQRLKELTEEYDRYYKALTDPANAPGAPRGLAGQPFAISADSVEAEKKKAKEIADAAKKTAEEFRDLVNSINLDIGRIVAKAEQEQRELAAKTVKQLGEESAARQQSNADLQAQVAAIQEGTGAYEALLVKQAQQIAVEKALSAARAAGIDEKTIDVQKIRDQIAENARLTKLLEALRALGGKNPFDLGDAVDNSGQLAENLSVVAGAAAGIATAFGEAGRNLAELLGSTSQLLTSLSRAQKAGIFTDLNGKEQNVGFTGALAGKAGSAGTLAAVSSSLATVAAVASVVRALDTFSDRAQKRSIEIAEAAQRFDTALKDFAAAANPTSGATAALEKLRREAVELQRGAIEKGGGTLVPGTTKPEQVTVAELRAQAAALLVEAERSRKKQADILRSVAAEYLKVAEALEANERAARAVVLAATEDLAVRRLQALGLAEEAERLRTAIAVRRELEAAEKDTTEEGKEYARILREVQAAEAALTAELQRRARIQQQLQDDNALLGGNASERLQRSVRAFGETFFTGLFDGLDLGSREGLEAAKQRARDFYKTLAADGISEAERPIVELLKTLIGDIDGAIGELPEILDPIATALEAFDARVALFGLSIPEQMAELARIFTGSFGDWFDSVLAGVDLTTTAGRDSFKQVLEDQLSAILADGIISEGERTLYDALRLMLGLVNQAIEDASGEAAQAAADAAANRQRNRDAASNFVDLFDLAGREAFTTILDGYGEAFAGLFGAFDLDTIAGLEAAKEQLRGIFVELRGMTDEDILAKFGMTREELIAALLDTDKGLEGLIGSLNDVEKASRDAANAAKSFAEQLSDDVQRARGNDRAADEAAARRRRDDRLKTLAGLTTLTDSERAVLASQIEEIYQGELRKIAERFAPPVAAAVEASIASVSPGRSSAAASDSAARPRTRNTTLVQDFGGLSELTAQSLAGLLREVAINTGETGAIVRALTRLPTMPLSSLQFPTFPTATAGSGGLVIGSITVNVGAIAAAGMAPEQAARATVDEIIRELGVRARREVKFLGDPRL